MKLEGVGGVKYLYHDLCHTPLKQQAPMTTVRALVGSETRLTERCCGEAGTFAASRPDIATQVRMRKAEELERGAAAQRQAGAEQVKVLTSCPSCLQGLNRYSEDNGVAADYIVVELARARLGQEWLRDFVDAVRRAGTRRRRHWLGDRQAQARETVRATSGGRRE